MQSPSFQISALRAVAHPIRSRIIMALDSAPRRFSRIMEFCGLDPSHDTGPFFYHLSFLMESGIVGKEDESYSLTMFGSQIAELLKAIRREAEYQVREIDPTGGGDGMVSTQGIKVRWAKEEEMSSGRYGMLILDTEKMEQRKDIDLEWELATDQLETYNEWIKSLPSMKGQRMLLAEREGKPAGCLVFRPMQELRGDFPGKVKSTTLADVTSIVVLEHGKARKEIAKALFRSLLNEGTANHLEKIKIVKIDSEDNKVVETLQELGFERTTTYYEMTKEA